MKSLMIVACLLFAAGCGIEDPDRPDRPAFKGMELYSWKPADGGWRFSLLPGTNRIKGDAEIRDPETAVTGAAELKRGLSALAKGEQVFWKNLAKEPVPDDLVAHLLDFCGKRDIKLNKP